MLIGVVFFSVMSSYLTSIILEDNRDQVKQEKINFLNNIYQKFQLTPALYFETLQCIHYQRDQDLSETNAFLNYFPTHIKYDLAMIIYKDYH